MTERRGGVNFGSKLSDVIYECPLGYNKNYQIIEKKTTVYSKMLITLTFFREHLYSAEQWLAETAF